jgi:hypothetical protein
LVSAEKHSGNAAIVLASRAGNNTALHSCPKIPEMY